MTGFPFLMNKLKLTGGVWSATPTPLDATGRVDPSSVERLVEHHVRMGVTGLMLAQCVRFVNEAAEVLGGLDVLVNNAAITGVPAIASLEKLTAADFSRLVGVNLGGVIFCSQAAVPHLRAAGGGTIIHISSVNAIRPQRGAMLYAATKAAVSSLAQSMGKELAPDRIRVVAVAPGDIRGDTSIQQHAELAARGVVSDVVNQTPLGPGTPEDIAETVAFLCSDRARFVTGTTWVVDGGLLA